MKREVTPPMLDCPECGVPLLPATDRGRRDKDGNEISHGIACRCRWCDWMWWEDDPVVRCKCGAVVCVEDDDGFAYAVTVDKDKPDGGGA